MDADYDRNIFINCPFDNDFESILIAMMFCIVYLGFAPRVATERVDSAENRLSKIVTLIEASKYSIHDLSRAQATQVDEYYRLNMPFELGIDYGCRRYSAGHAGKKILILEERRFRHQIAISDLAGCDMEIHDGDFQIAIRKVRNWLAGEARVKAPGATHILSAYLDFQKWHYEKQMAAGFSEDDIKDYPTGELLESMEEWATTARPA